MSLKKTFHDYSPHTCPLVAGHHQLLLDDSGVPASGDARYDAARAGAGILTLQCTKAETLEGKPVKMRDIERRRAKLERRARRKRRRDPCVHAMCSSSSSDEDRILYSSSSSSSSESSSSDDDEQPAPTSYWAMLASYPHLLLNCTYDVPQDLDVQVRFPFKYEPFTMPLRFMFCAHGGDPVELARVMVCGPLTRTKVADQRDLFQHEVRMEHGHYRVIVVTRRLTQLDDYDVLHGVILEMTTEYLVACLRQAGARLGKLPVLECQ